jgi:hypothetical protein
MNENQISEGLQMMAKFFAIKTQAPDAPAILEVPPVAPTLPQAAVSVPVIQSPPVKPYEPIGRGRAPKILLTVILIGIASYLLNRKFKDWKKRKKQS